jgi:hypothetical protein
MARDITVIVKLSGENSTAGVQITTANGRWSKSEPGGADKVFKTKHGPYRVIGTSTELLRDGGGNRVGRLANFVPDTVVDKSTGDGLSDDAGTAITWKVDGILNV